MMYIFCIIKGAMGSFKHYKKMLKFYAINYSFINKFIYSTYLLVHINFLYKNACILCVEPYIFKVSCSIHL